MHLPLGCPSGRAAGAGRGRGGQPGPEGRCWPLEAAWRVRGPFPEPRCSQARSWEGRGAAASAGAGAVVARAQAAPTAPPPGTSQAFQSPPLPPAPRRARTQVQGGHQGSERLSHLSKPRGLYLGAAGLEPQKLWLDHA